MSRIAYYESDGVWPTPCTSYPSHIFPRPSHTRTCPLSVLCPNNVSFAPSLVIRKVYQRIDVEDIGTLKSYHQWGKHYGLEFMGFDDHADNLVVH